MSLIPEGPEAAQAAKSRVLAAQAARATETLEYHFDHFIRLSQHTVWHLKAQIQPFPLPLSAL